MTLVERERYRSARRLHRFAGLVIYAGWFGGLAYDWRWSACAVLALLTMSGVSE